MMVFPLKTFKCIEYSCHNRVLGRVPRGMQQGGKWGGLLQKSNATLHGGGVRFIGQVSEGYDLKWGLVGGRQAQTRRKTVHIIVTSNECSAVNG